MKALLLRGSKGLGDTNMHMSLYNPIKKLLHFLKIDYNISDVDVYDYDGYDIYIGFSTSCIKLQYIQEKYPNKLYIGIGDNIDGIYSFKNQSDLVLKGDLSTESLQQHFNINNIMLDDINNIINEYVIEHKSVDACDNDKHIDYRIDNKINDFYSEANNRVDILNKCDNVYIGEFKYTFPVKNPFNCEYHCGLIKAALQYAITVKNYKIIHKAQTLFNKHCKGE